MGTGEHRPILALSGKVPMRGDEVTDGDMAAFVLLEMVLGWFRDSRLIQQKKK